MTLYSSYKTLTFLFFLIFTLLSNNIFSQELIQPYILKSDGEVIISDKVNVGTYRVVYRKNGTKYKLKKKEVKYALEGEKQVYSHETYNKEVLVGKIKIGLSADAEGTFKEEGIANYDIAVRNGDKMIVRRDLDNPNGNVVYQYFLIEGNKVIRFHEKKLNDKYFLDKLLEYFNICPEIKELIEEYMNSDKYMIFGDLNTFNSTMEYIYLKNCFSVPEGE